MSASTTELISKIAAQAEQITRLRAALEAFPQRKNFKVPLVYMCAVTDWNHNMRKQALEGKP